MSSSSSTTALESWALPRLSALLPTAFGSDSDTLKEIIAYAAGLPAEQAAAHFRELLGESDPRVWEFIAGFNGRRPGERSRGGNQVGGGDGADVTKKKKEVKERERTKGAPPPSAQGPLVSDYLPNVRSKMKKAGNARAGSSKAVGAGAGAMGGRDSDSSRSATPTLTLGSGSGSTVTTTTNNIADLTSAIAALELTTNPKAGTDSKGQGQGKGKSPGSGSGSAPRKCTCNASVHPLFTPAPNCLSCGKIICALEGLQPCSFCGTPLLSAAEVQDMIRELRAERGNEKMKRHNESIVRSGAGPGSVPAHAEKSEGSAEGDGSVDTSNLAAAKAHRDKLLSFQAQNAKRTRVVDEAADFDVPGASGTQWMSPAQRALALKKQQRVLREMEDRARPEWEKRQMVVSLDLKTGKAVKTFEKESPRADAEEQEEDEEELPEPSGQNSETGGAFARNPLLKSAGLVRPVWKASDDGRGQERRREQKQTWRRVQDDETDNEQWILDGGLHGYEGVDTDRQ